MVKVFLFSFILTKPHNFTRKGHSFPPVIKLFIARRLHAVSILKAISVPFFVCFIISIKAFSSFFLEPVVNVMLLESPILTAERI